MAVYISKLNLLYSWNGGRIGNTNRYQVETLDAFRSKIRLGLEQVKLFECFDFWLRKNPTAICFCSFENRDLMLLTAGQLIPLSYVEKMYWLKPNSHNNGKWWKVISMQMVLTNALYISCLLWRSKLLCLTLIELRPKLSFNLVVVWSIFMGHCFNWLLLRSVGFNSMHEYWKDISPSINSSPFPPPPPLEAIK